jgi:hypothetical protein
MLKFHCKPFQRTVQMIQQAFQMIKPSYSQVVGVSGSDSFLRQDSIEKVPLCHLKSPNLGSIARAMLRTAACTRSGGAQKGCGLLLSPNRGRLNSYRVPYRSATMSSTALMWLLTTRPISHKFRRSNHRMRRENMSMHDLPTIVQL